MVARRRSPRGCPGPPSAPRTQGPQLHRMRAVQRAAARRQAVPELRILTTAARPIRPSPRRRAWAGHRRARESPDLRSRYETSLARQFGKNPGWPYHLYLTKFGEKPDWNWRGLESPPTPEVRSYVRSRQIAYAKARGAA